jgi:catechol 2,3-dioxygenase-like lactoylglutathione lyase family enzyme
MLLLRDGPVARPAAKIVDTFMQYHRAHRAETAHHGRATPMRSATPRRAAYFLRFGSTPHRRELALRASDGKHPWKLSFGWRSNAARADACSRETSLNPETLLSAVSISPATNPVDATTAGRSQESPYLRIFKSTVFVRNHDRSLEFYVGQLGFSVVADTRFEFGGRWVAVAPPDGSAILALVAPKRGSENFKRIGQHTQIAFIAEDINATFELWRSRGVRFQHPPQKSLFGGASASFYDVDGNCFELLGSDELSREIEAQRQAIAQKLESERRAAQELEIAKQVQARLFPQSLPAVASLDYAGICIQARHVGGDYYDFLALGQKRLGLLIGDISGKGIAAALLMANLQANLRSQFALAREQPRLLLRSVNRLFYENTADSAYATFFFAEFD